MVTHGQKRFLPSEAVGSEKEISREKEQDAKVVWQETEQKVQLPTKRVESIQRVTVLTS